MHSDPSHVVAFNCALASVNTAADRQSQTANHVPDRAGAFNRARWTVKGCEDTVARGVHYAAAETHDFLANLLMIVVDQVAPARVPNRRDALGRLDNVDEEDGCENTVRLQHGSFARQKLLDLRQQRIGVADPGNVIIARKLDELCGGICLAM